MEMEIAHNNIEKQYNTYTKKYINNKFYIAKQICHIHKTQIRGT